MQICAQNMIFKSTVIVRVLKLLVNFIRKMSNSFVIRRVSVAYVP